MRRNTPTIVAELGSASLCVDRQDDMSCVAVCCSVLQCVAVCCSVLQCVAVYCDVFQCCSVLQCVAEWARECISLCGQTEWVHLYVWQIHPRVWCDSFIDISGMQEIEIHCNTLQPATWTHRNTLQHSATHCNTMHYTLQHTAIHCSTLQLTQTAKHDISGTREMKTHCNTLQHNALRTAAHCSTLQHTATHSGCST